VGEGATFRVWLPGPGTEPAAAQDGEEQFRGRGRITLTVPLRHRPARTKPGSQLVEERWPTT
jgi:hypothetical protein